MSIEIKVPSLGDGVESADVLEVLVSEGDTIEKDQGIVELETDKATAVVPSTDAGKVIKVHVGEGDTVPVGAVLLSIEAAAGEATVEPAAPTATPRKGAIQGVATTVANTPEKKLPDKPGLRENSAPSPVIDRPISKTPLRLRPKRKSKIASTNTKAGSCS